MDEDGCKGSDSEEKVREAEPFIYQAAKNSQREYEKEAERRATLLEASTLYLTTGGGRTNHYT